ncbi:MAG: SDR family oxidoreductase [Saprospiraceae bacterium]
MNSLKGKVIIVTGGSGLLGMEMLHELHKRGAKAINFDIKPSNIEGIDFYEVNTTIQIELREALNQVFHKYKKIDGLVNNAYPRTKNWGISFAEDLDLNSWRENVDLQLNSYVACCQEVLPYMQEQKSGAIVNIASIYGVVGNDFTIYEGTGLKTAAPYSAIKGGLINFSRYLASFYGKDNIRVNCLSPGGIFDNQHPTFVKNYEYKVPMKRMGTPKDIASPVSFLLSDDAQYITGQNLIVDGGWTCI